MGVVRTASEVAQQIVEEGVACEDRLEMFMERLEAEGLRYCPLADEILRGDCEDEERELPAGERGYPMVAEECEALANSLAEMNERGEIRLSAAGVRLVGAALTDGDAEGAANSMAERDQRGEITVSDEELSLIRCLLGEEEEIPCEGLANSLAEMNERGEISLSEGVVELIRVIGSVEDAERVANHLAERDQRGEIELTDEELSLVRCVLGPEEEVRVEVPVVPVARPGPDVWSMAVPLGGASPQGVYIPSGTFADVFAAAQTWLPIAAGESLTLSQVPGPGKIVYTSEGVTGL